jgi:hypothetical protein
LRNCQFCTYSRDSYNFMVHYRVHKSPPLDPNLSQIDPVHTTPSYLSNINLILSAYLSHVVPSGLFPSVFPTNILYAFSFARIRATYPSNLIFPDSTILNYTWRKVQVLKLLITQFSPTSCHFSLRCKYSPQHPVL